MDDWQSFYVLLNLMIGANNREMKDRADIYIQRARQLCSEDTIKAALLESLIAELYLEYQPTHM